MCGGELGCSKLCLKPVNFADSQSVYGELILRLDVENPVYE
jgi:hypothetical protein